MFRSSFILSVAVWIAYRISVMCAANPKNCVGGYIFCTNCDGTGKGLRGKSDTDCSYCHGRGFKKCGMCQENNLALAMMAFGDKRGRR